MPIIRTHRNGNYKTIANYPFNDSRLSMKAKGIIAYILVHQDSWDVYLKDLVKKSKDGKDSVRSGLDELIELGYIHRETKRTEDGTFNGHIYHVFEHPGDNYFSNTTQSGLTESGFSDFGEPALSNNRIEVNKELSKEEKKNPKKKRSQPQSSPPKKDPPQYYGSLPDTDNVIWHQMENWFEKKFKTNQFWNFNTVVEEFENSSERQYIGKNSTMADYDRRFRTYCTKNYHLKQREVYQ